MTQLIAANDPRPIRHYEVVDRKTGAVIGKYKTRNRAMLTADKMDNRLGGYRHTCRVVYKTDDQH